MIDRIVIRDDTEGEFVYERDPGDSFKWTLTWPHGTKSAEPHDGRDVAWNVALAVTEGVER